MLSPADLICGLLSSHICSPAHITAATTAEEMSEPAETATASAASASDTTVAADNGPLLALNELHDILMESAESDGDDNFHDDVDSTITSVDVDNVSSSSDDTLELEEEKAPPPCPAFPEPDQLSVEQLETKIRIHREAKNLIDCLATADTDTLDNAVQHT